MQRLRAEVGQKVDLCNKKTKIYQTIKGPDHSIYQAPVLYQVQLSLQTIAYPTSASVPTALLLASYPMHSYHPPYNS